MINIEAILSFLKRSGLKLDEKRFRKRLAEQTDSDMKQLRIEMFSQFIK